jgi:hypothetical protein
MKRANVQFFKKNGHSIADCSVFSHTFGVCPDYRKKWTFEWLNTTEISLLMTFHLFPHRGR